MGNGLFEMGLQEFGSISYADLLNWVKGVKETSIDQILGVLIRWVVNYDVCSNVSDQRGWNF